MFIPEHFRIANREEIEKFMLKFSQNKRSDDIAAIIDGLKASGRKNAAEFMARVNRSVS